MVNLRKDGSRYSQLSRTQYEGIMRILNDLLLRSAARCVVLADDSGSCLAFSGTLAEGVQNQQSAQMLAALGAASFSASAEVSQLFNSPPFRTVLYQGEETSMLLTGEPRQYVLVVVFDAESNFGMVRLHAEQCKPGLEFVFESLAEDGSAPDDSAEGPSEADAAFMADEFEKLIWGDD